jgi:putative transposase
LSAGAVRVFVCTGGGGPVLAVGRGSTRKWRKVIKQMAAENPGWAAPRIHGEIRKPGFAISERTVARYLRPIHRKGDPAKRWLAFLRNHRELIIAFNFFTVPTVTFRLLYCFFVIEHDRRRILHFNVTRHPTADWIVQQLREALPEAPPYRYAIFDHDANFNDEVISFLRSTALQPQRTTVRSPWQNGTAEHWVGCCRREILDQLIPVNEDHLRRLIRDYVRYYEEDRIHDSLSKDTPRRRPVEPKPATDATLIAQPRLGGLHHRYTWRHAA